MLSIQLILKALNLVQTVGLIQQLDKGTHNKTDHQGNGAQQVEDPQPEARRRSGREGTAKWGLWVALASACHLIHKLIGLHG